MRLATILILVSLTLQAQQTPATAKVEPSPATAPMVTPAPDPNALTPAHVATWNQINQALNSADQAVNRAKIALLDAQEGRQQAEADRRALREQAELVLAKMRKEAHCDNCIPESKPDGSATWKKPPVE